MKRRIPVCVFFGSVGAIGNTLLLRQGIQGWILPLSLFGLLIVVALI